MPGHPGMCSAASESPCEASLHAVTLLSLLGMLGQMLGMVSLKTGTQQVILGTAWVTQGALKVALGMAT